ncbi:MAG TPA: ferrous iron transport protein A [Bdellovibrionales bacterium]|nr:MAG: hypothetical protein A2Z97_14400 [Bdellovibrionales bacterium GWB1_52_6]OFZ06195.1 MAG: hypothetical protein A2X97_09080 [Bdellovibrionales bacterium GWA1_52_35]OFZ37993.1 MAG: hypothetical protein A2070_00355 [Bdellovibrionales bacterium GWC1_52_8]HAR43780.1 ferrous iron transport protein A [Bdellovibrionales bacterium]HCM41162.1 ferrous iron transport protein A [Bdellovibrionales bacterium]
MRPMGLGEIPTGSFAQIVSIEGDAGRLLLMGLLEGALVQVVHQAPFGGDPIAVRVRGTLIALRRGEANFVKVVPHVVA